MLNVSVKKQIGRRLPKLATAAFIFWGLSSSSPLDAAPSWMGATDLPSLVAPQTNLSDLKRSIHILSPKDADLYRAAFDAQKKADWTFADQALAQISDKRLVGHILADRYLNRTVSLDEAKNWLASYEDLPEAPLLYKKVRKLREFAKAPIEKPQTAPDWQANNGFDSSSRFKSTNDNFESPEQKSYAVKINASLRRNDPTKARDILAEGLNKGYLSITWSGDLASRTAAAFFYRGDVENARALAKLAANSSSPLGLWIEGLSAWKQHDFGSSVHAFDELFKIPELSEWNKSAAAYWAYRATSRQGDKTQSYKWLAEAAKYPQSFYGAMAARLMERKASFSLTMPRLNEKMLSLIASTPAGLRALGLIQVGQTGLAEDELRQVLSVAGSSSMQKAVLALAEEAQMPSLLLQLASVTANDNGKPYDAALYPVPPWQPSGGFTVDRALIYAIMRRESLFDPRATSAQGACGLMQIMPSTARHIDNDFIITGSAANCNERLFDPETNVAMGQKYVRSLSEKPMIGDNLLFLLASYNAGPGNLARWLAENDRSDPLLFIESLPARETRDYVQQVLVHYWMYRSRLEQPEKSVTELARGEWPRYVSANELQPKRAQGSGLEVASLEPLNAAPDAKR